jgi:hypothetical protein
MMTGQSGPQSPVTRQTCDLEGGTPLPLRLCRSGKDFIGAEFVADGERHVSESAKFIPSGSG